MDNGPDYSPQSALVIHDLYRIFRQFKLVALLAGSHAPYHSALHWQVEQQWNKARHQINGQHLG
eukprot:3729593-Karenia_brevis.AAC.1